MLVAWRSDAQSSPYDDDPLSQLNILMPMLAQVGAGSR
jgi:hypothetical protein